MAPSGALTVRITPRIARTAPVISFTVSPRAFMATRKPASCISGMPPSMMASNASAASSSVSASPQATFSKCGRNLSAATGPSAVIV
jgi:hypothetical protein